MKIVVLAGGTSTERDVSIVSGTGICQALRQKGHQAILVDVFCGLETVNWEDPFPAEYDVEKAAEYIKGFNPQMKELKKTRRDFFGSNVIELCKKADFVFLGLHGANGEDGKLQAAFDLFGVKYTGSDYLSSAIAMNKETSKQFFLANGIPTPKGISMTRATRQDDITKLDLTLPCVVKPCCGGSSIGVTIVRDAAEFKAALDDAFKWENELVIEEFVQGREFSVGVIEGKALPIIEIAPKEGFYDYKNKYKAGSTVETCPAELPEQVTKDMQHYAEEVARVIGLDTYSRSDFLLNDKNEMFCLEANTLPGMTPTSLLPQEAAVIGMSFNQLCEHLIDISLKKYEV
jgi:D-alanine-D-alanine ligase